MHIIIEKHDKSSVYKRPDIYRDSIKSQSPDHQYEHQSSGFTWEELRRIVAEQID
ncbi:hypothetical protein ABIC60_003250 [Phyllobacterium ifriqiyense]